CADCLYVGIKRPAKPAEACGRLPPVAVLVPPSFATLNHVVNEPPILPYHYKASLIPLAISLPFSPQQKFKPGVAIASDHLEGGSPEPSLRILDALRRNKAFSPRSRFDLGSSQTRHFGCLGT